jgi:mono/diheme cytochrome c family protein
MRYRTLLTAAFLLLPVARASAAVDAQAIWEKKCASCHGKDGMAQTTMGRKQKIDDMTTAKWQQKNTDAHIHDVIVNGVKDTKMKPFKDKLSPEEIDALVKYVRTLKK